MLAVGYDSLCLIDSDSPTLPPALMAQAVAALSQPGDRMVIGASDDGGYYLIGLKAAHLRLFNDITWSTSQVLAQTIERATEIGLDVTELPPWYDVDDAATLARLCDELFGDESNHNHNDDKPETVVPQDSATGYRAPHTREYLARILAAEGRGRIWSPETAGAVSR